MLGFLYHKLSSIYRLCQDKELFKLYISFTTLNSQNYSGG